MRWKPQHLNLSLILTFVIWSYLNIYRVVHNNEHTEENFNKVTHYYKGNLKEQVLSFTYCYYGI